jgi:hypothetical protein
MHVIAIDDVWQWVCECEAKAVDFVDTVKTVSAVLEYIEKNERTDRILKKPAGVTQNVYSCLSYVLPKV